MKTEKEFHKDVSVKMGILKMQIRYVKNANIPA